jgi:hypothetical protein
MSRWSAPGPPTALSRSDAEDSMRSILDQVEDEAQYQRTNTMVSTLLLAKVMSTYLPTAKIAGYGDNQARNPNFHRHLGRTVEEDHQAGLPFRASLIVNAKMGLPGEQYFEKARALGYKIAYNDEPLRAGEVCERDFWFRQLDKLGVARP